jgi:iron complex outermembrane receptor protein
MVISRSVWAIIGKYYLPAFLVVCDLHGQAVDTVHAVKEISPGEVVIVGQRTPAVYSNLARKIIILSTEKIESVPASTVHDLLKFAGGIDVRQRNSHGVQADIQFRGGTFDEVMIMLNGINITDPQTGHFNLDLPVELSSVERVEILHGNGARIYGANAYKGVINIITRKNSDRLTAGVSYGQHELFHANASLSRTKGEIFNELSLSRNISGGYVKNTDYAITHLYYQGAVNNRKYNINWQGGLSNRAFGANSFYSPAFPDQYEETGTGFGNMGIELKGKIRLTGTGYWRRHADHFLLKRDDPGFYENYHLTDIFGMRINAGFRSAFGKTSLGLEVREENIKSTVLGEELPAPVKVRGTDSTYYGKAFTRNSVEAFFEQNYICGNLSVTGGFMSSFHREYKKKIGIFPGIDISYRIPGNKVKIFTSLNRALRLPTFTDMFYKDPSGEGDPDLEPEELMAFETGAEYRVKYLETSLTLFRDKGDHVIDWIWLPGRKVYKAMNITEVTTRGLEITGEYHPEDTGHRILRMNNFGASWSFTDLEKSTGNFESKYSLDFLKHKLQFYITGSIIGKIYSTWYLSYFSRNGSYIKYDLPAQTMSITPFRPYWIADTKLWYTFRSLRFQLEISNLLNDSYTDIGNLVPPGKWITAGIIFDLPFSN